MTVGLPRKHRSLLAMIREAILSGLIFILAGCAEESPVISHSDSAESRYRQESEPARSPDGQHVYYITADTLDPSRSGLYRAKIVKPVREELYNGVGLSSPSASPNGNIVAFLDSSSIAYFRISDSQRLPSAIIESFTGLVMLNDDKLIGQRGDSLFLLSESNGTRQFVALGSDPTLVRPDTFAYVVPMLGYAFGVVTCGLPEMEPDTVYYISTATSSGRFAGQCLTRDPAFWHGRRCTRIPNQSLPANYLSQTRFRSMLPSLRSPASSVPSC